MRFSNSALVMTTILSLLSSTHAGVLYHSNFSTTIFPFSVCNVKKPSYAAIENGHLTTFFNETNFDGTRDDKGVEICVFRPGTRTNVYQMKKEGWQGFKLFVPPAPVFPDKDKDTIIAQQFCPATPCSSWCAELTLSGNDIKMSHRPACGDATTKTIVKDFKRGKWIDVVVHMKVSRVEKGEYEVWWDRRRVYSQKKINVGFGNWTDEDVMTPESGWYFKNGQYAYDTPNYTNVTRTLLFDDVKWYETDKGEWNGFITVPPSCSIWTPLWCIPFL